MMEPLYQVKEEYPEYGGQSSSQFVDPPPSGVVAPPPMPMEGLHDAGPPPFLTKTFEMVDDHITDGIVSWSRGGHSFVVWDAHAFSTALLPTYFKHNNFSSFVRQLNTYGFRKIDPDKWEFANEWFQRGQKHLLRNIRRRKSHSQLISPQPPIGMCVELGRFGVDGEVDRLKRDKQALLMELVRLRQQQQSTRAYLQSMELRLQGTERRQQHMMSFLAKAMRNPEFLQKLIEKGKRKEIEEAITKKRRRPIEHGGSSSCNGGLDGEYGRSSDGFNNFSSIKAEPLDYDGFYQVSELEALALEMQGFSRSSRVEEEEDGGELDEGFWDDLLNQAFDEELEGTEIEIQDDGEDVNLLADRLGILGSSPK